jgi:hypothetical protein
MRAPFLIFVAATMALAQCASGYAQETRTPPASATSATDISGPEAQSIDGIAVRIDTDVITESEVRELGDFQMLVDGSSKPRDEIITELCDQWIVHGEAETARFPHPSDKDIDNAYARLAKLFESPEAFAAKVTQAGLTQTAVRRELEAQLYLSDFIDFRFRQAAEVDDAAVQKYYDEQFAPQLKAKGEAVPPLDKVHDTIHEVLVQQAINARAEQWLDDTRAHLEIDVLPQAGGAQ